MSIPLPIVVAAATAAGALALMGPGGGTGAGVPAAVGASGFARVSTGDCNDWNAASIDRRLRLVDELGDHFGHRSAIWPGATLPDAEARRTLQAACDAPQAADIKLYKIYSRALTFRAYREHAERVRQGGAR